MAAPTPQDAQLVVQLAQLAAAQGLNEATDWLFANEMPTAPEAFRERYPAGSEGHRHVTAVLNYMETIGALWKHGLLNEDLLFDWLWITGVWEPSRGWRWPSVRSSARRISGSISKPWLRRRSVGTRPTRAERAPGAHAASV
jgi:hypothetical protein